MAEINKQQWSYLAKESSFGALSMFTALMLSLRISIGMFDLCRRRWTSSLVVLNSSKLLSWMKNSSGLSFRRCIWKIIKQNLASFHPSIYSPQTKVVCVVLILFHIARSHKKITNWANCNTSSTMKTTRVLRIYFLHKKKDLDYGI